MSPSKPLRTLVAAACLASGLTLTGPSAGAAPAEDATPVEVEPLTPIWVTLGAGRPVAGASVDVVDESGAVVATTTTNARGTASVPRSQTPVVFTLRVHGGSLEALGDDVELVAQGVRRPRGAMRVVHVSPVSTIAAQVARRADVSNRRAERLVMTRLGFPHWMSQAQVATTRGAFDKRAFARLVVESGGPRQAMSTLGRRIADGRGVPSLSAVQRTVDRASTPRSASAGGDDRGRMGLATYVGVQLMAGVVGGIASGGTSFALGSIFGAQDPTATALAEIAEQLAEINKNLMIIQAQMSKLIVGQASSDYTTIAKSMSLAVTNTESQWSSYDWFMNHADPTSPTYLATVQSFAEDFQSNLQPYVALYNSMLSTAGSMGLIEAMYKLQRASNPWWNATDIAAMQGTIDYYGTLQAQASALMAESWQFESPTYKGTKTPEYVDAQVSSNYKPLNDKIYKSMPTSIDQNEVVNYSSQRAYRLSPTTAPNSYVQAYGSKRSSSIIPSYNLPSKCSNYDKKSSYSGKAPTQVSSTTVKSWWQAVVPSGAALSDNGEFSNLSTARPDGGTALRILKNGAPNATLLVTSASVPSVSAMDGNFAGWGWCGGVTVSLSDTSKWTVDPTTYYSLASGSLLGTKSPDVGATWPVGVLTHRSGTFTYVAS